MKLSAIIIGNESLTRNCAEKWLAAGHSIARFVTHNGELADWAETQGLAVVAAGEGLGARLVGAEADWLLSIANLDMLGEDVLALPKRGCVNFHDSPLPRYAGLNAPVWAKLNGETEHGITWHFIEAGVDTGDVILQVPFAITPHDTALTLNTKAYEAAFSSFDELMRRLAQPEVACQPQDSRARSYFGKFQRPEAFATLDFTAQAEDILALVLGLDHGPYWNPLTTPRLIHGGQVVAVKGAVASGLPKASVPAGTVIDVSERSVTVATGTAPVVLKDLMTLGAAPLKPSELFVKGAQIATLTQEARDALSAAQDVAARGDTVWRNELRSLVPATLGAVRPTSAGATYERLPLNLPDGIDQDELWRRFAGLVQGLSGEGAADLAFVAGTAPAAEGHVSGWVPLRYGADFASRLKAARKHPCFAGDLVLRDPQIERITPPEIALSEIDAAHDNSLLTLCFKSIYFDSSKVSPALASLWVARLEHIARLAVLEANPSNWPLMPEAERGLVVQGWNNTESEAETTPVHRLFEAQVARTPEAIALVFEGEALSYATLNARANKAAHVLRDMGVGAGTLVGLCVHRGPQLLIGALAILKAGGAYVPIDPAYPEDRIALYINDSAAPVIVSQASLAPSLPKGRATMFVLDADPRIAMAPEADLPDGAGPEDLAYLIYTSGSTGRPKGVMVEHRNVANFFTGMDERLEKGDAPVWLAVTSLSFDISVLELFYTLARGYKLVLAGDESKSLVSNGRISMTEKGMDFGLFYWGNDDGPGKKKYNLLLEGAKFADSHGFSAVWTPERHFHAFGGPYPNPSVTGAAVAAVTKNIAVRSGSCVAPLHHPLRIAEEWAVIDNLTEGRAGLAIASGWQPDDFVLRPENAPPANKPAMYEAINQLRALWRGEAVSYPNGSGKDVAVVTQPRPVSAELPIWVTTAGNPDTWREAGEIGANVLTHLLGQSIDEVGDKIKIYREALEKAGHNPDDFTVTLMLHTFVSDTRDHARDIARQPMKDYLNAAAGLIKQYAWAFPAFKKPKGVDNPFQLDLEILAAEELDAILEFAFERYFEDSGLFGTVEDCLDRVEQLKRIGVDEIGCLIDYGIDPDVVLEGLKPLAEVHRRTNEARSVNDDDFSLAAQIVRHNVTHLQCTPSLARMLTLNEESRMALSRLKHLMIGGEALPANLVSELQSLTDASIENMYGPTETTIWSTTETVQGGEDTVNIGTPIANTQVYVLDENMQPCPVGVAGELFIGGAGVARGYFQREDLTAERFLPNPFHTGRMYRTGDLVRWQADGKLGYIGRADTQVKLRGYRIELGEIEARLHEQASIRQAVVMARQDTPGDMRLVAYLLSSGALDEAALRAALARDLPEFMIPQHFVIMKEFPLTPNKKVDRNALPAPSAVAQPDVRQDAPVIGSDDAIEAEISGIWTKVLGVANVRSHDNFFDLGGHSLLAVQAHREIRELCTVPRLSITDVFRFPTLGALAARVRELGASVSGKKAEAPKPKAKPQPEVSVDETMSRRRQMRARRQLARAS
ncbi:MupA/Atu3671 family FMN-dependent luciferase-like monooxygenase [Lentibacter sp.]|uniref:MupA/Atu3671 family FMN-dependent luciferase-like monooxygenase n=1 Tax=Lentibacter sp. TaxID=2024994 RepID=UPI003F6CDA1E